MNRLIILFVSFIVLLSINVAAELCLPDDCTPLCSIDCFCTGDIPNCYCDCGEGGPGLGGSCCLPGETEYFCPPEDHASCWLCHEVWVKCIPCGIESNECCPGNVCATNLVCINNVCVYCGSESQVCCSGDSCNSGLYCSFGQNDIQDAGEQGFCCLPGSYWDGSGCATSTNCNTQWTIGDPSGSLNWYPLPWEQACCSMFIYGETALYWTTISIY